MVLPRYINIDVVLLRVFITEYRTFLFRFIFISESDSLGCLLSLYVARMHPLWSSPNVLPWLEKNIATVLNLVEPKQLHLSESNTIDPRLSEYSKR